MSFLSSLKPTDWFQDIKVISDVTGPASVWSSLWLSLFVHMTWLEADSPAHPALRHQLDVFTQWKPQSPVGGGSSTRLPKKDLDFSEQEGVMYAFMELLTVCCLSRPLGVTRRNGRPRLLKGSDDFNTTLMSRWTYHSATHHYNQSVRPWLHVK